MLMHATQEINRITTPRICILIVPLVFFYVGAPVALADEAIRAG
jgi:hypothetical protein